VLAARLATAVLAFCPAACALRGPEAARGWEVPGAANMELRAKEDKAIVVREAALAFTSLRPGDVTTYVCDAVDTRSRFVGDRDFEILLEHQARFEGEAVRLRFHGGGEFGVAVTAHASIAETTDTDPYVLRWRDLEGEVRYAGDPFQKAQTFDGRFQVAGFVGRKMRFVTGAFHCADPSSGRCSGRSGNGEHNEKGMPADPWGS
jgi:hypothetical protein